MSKLKLFCLFSFAIFVGCQTQKNQPDSNTSNQEKMKFNVEKSEEEWKASLTPEQYYILREKGTERPNTGEYNLFFEDGTYHCAACGAALFKSDSKFESHCGWPSFDSAIRDSAIVEQVDTSHGMMRTEIMCGNCGGHLGHVFDDGPTKTGLRYCVNSISVGFEAKKDTTE